MVSEFRKKKILEIFSYYDTDKTGNIDKKGFESGIQEITKALGWQPGDAKYKEVQDTMLKVWDGIQKTADVDNDGKVSADEWIAVWDKFAKNPSNPLEWQHLYCKFCFWLYDSSSDESIDCEEFCTVNASFGINKDEAVVAFKKISKGKPNVSWSEYQELWKEYFSSEDPNAPGNYIFVKTSF